VEIGKAEGAKVLTGGERAGLGGELSGGYYARPTVFEGSSSMRIFQEEIFGPVLALTSFADEADALKIANDSLHGLGAGVWTTDGARAYRVGARPEGPGLDQLHHAYPAHAAFGGYKQSGVGRVNRMMMLGHYQQARNLMVSYSPKKLGFF
jgi:aldehyde dehydrogenase